MLKKKVQPAISQNVIARALRTTFALSLFALNTISCGTAILLLAPFKLLLLPFVKPQQTIHRICLYIAGLWVELNNLNMALTQKIKWEITGLPPLEKNDWYFIIANHQSALDIVILQRVFSKKIPFLKFLVKKELFWLPILGQCWWLLGFPFVTRQKKSFRKDNKTAGLKDFNTLRNTCKKLQQAPSTLISFLEGTRFTEEKKQRRLLRYKYLLPPKAGSFSLIVNQMERKIKKIIDVTIVYPNGPKSLPSLFNGRVKHVIINIKLINISNELIGNYETDPIYKTNIQQFLNKIWKEKDKLIDSIHTSYS